MNKPLSLRPVRTFPHDRADETIVYWDAFSDGKAAVARANDSPKLAIHDAKAIGWVWKSEVRS